MTTKFAIKLLRKDGVVADFPLLDERDFVEEPVFSRRMDNDTINDMKVQYVKRVGFEPVVLEIETYIELLSSDILAPMDQSWQTVPGVYGENGPSYDITYLPTFRPFNDSDYDGTCTYYFEAVCQNKSKVNSGYVYLVDETDSIVATIEVPKNSYEYDGADYYRFSVEFTPNGSSSYGLRAAIANIGYMEDWNAGEAILFVTEATIVIHQEGPTKSCVHIPMMTYVNTGMCYKSVPKGAHYISDGEESLGAISIWTTDYPDCEMDEDDYSQCRNIWKFSDEELASVDRFVFDAGVGWHEGASITPSRLQIIGTPDLSWVCACLRWSTANVTTLSYSTGGTCEDATAIDLLGETFTMVDNLDGDPSSGTWSQSADGNTWSLRVDLDIDSLMAADGHYLYISSNENPYGGDIPNGPWHHWNKWRNFSIPVGYTLQSAWLDYEVYFDEDRGDHVFDITFDYIISADGVINTAYIILYDKTADVYVAGSELVWDEWTVWERKTTTLSSSALISGHEYIARWKIDEDYVDWRAYPEVSDINLFVYVTDITAFTSWRRVSKATVNDFVFGYIYDDWCIDCDHDGCMNIHSRAKLFVPEDLPSEIYYECSVWDYGGSDPSIAYLYDTGEDDDAIGSDISERVLESAITLGEVGDGFTYRSRSGLITSMVDQRRYVDDLPGDYWEYEMLSGFIVVKYR